jgi:hypothetical protein
MPAFTKASSQLFPDALIPMSPDISSTSKVILNDNTLKEYNSHLR